MLDLKSQTIYNVHVQYIDLSVFSVWRHHILGRLMRASSQNSSECFLFLYLKVFKVIDFKFTFSLKSKYLHVSELV